MLDQLLGVALGRGGERQLQIFANAHARDIVEAKLMQPMQHGVALGIEHHGFSVTSTRACQRWPTASEVAASLITVSIPS